jgi:hypothetical protein
MGTVPPTVLLICSEPVRTQQAQQSDESTAHGKAQEEDAGKWRKDERKGVRVREPVESHCSEGGVNTTPADEDSSSVTLLVGRLDTLNRNAPLWPANKGRNSQGSPRPPT